MTHKELKVEWAGYGSYIVRLAICRREGSRRLRGRINQLYKWKDNRMNAFELAEIYEQLYYDEL